jgi:hypothetical protein
MLRTQTRFTLIWKAFVRSTAGGLATFAAVAVPGVAIVGIGAVELASINAERTMLQDAADMAALLGAKELALASHEGLTDRVEGYALGQLSSLAGRTTVSAEATIDGDRLRVQVSGNRPGFFGNLVPPGGFWTRVAATAKAEAGPPLCVMTLSSKKSEHLYVKDAAQLRAPSCLVHSNAAIKVDKYAALTAGAVQAVKSAAGPITPTATIGVAGLADPLAERDIPTATCRGGEPEVTYTGPVTLPAGVHCGGIIADKDAVVTLAPGVHFFAHGDLKLRKTATLKGNDVVLVFGTDATLKSQDWAWIDLIGRQSGALAGMVLVSTRDNPKGVELFSANVRRLEGVIYLPAAELLVIGVRPVAAESDWTVTIAKEVLVRGGARLVINSRFAESPVPVPDGVGPSASGARLLH